MSITRNNHYVPQWYQELFFPEGRNVLHYLDLQPAEFRRKDGSVAVGRNLFESPSSRAFVQKDLYSTFFGTQVNDEIERKLFGEIDGLGAPAVKAFLGSNKSNWIENFESLFVYLDAQKIRTPKGLDWLRNQYPDLSQNELMQEMQNIRFLHNTIWTTGVREIVSAETSNTKFIVTDHPVTIYNSAVPPSDRLNRYPEDPSIALKGSQTLFPLGPDHCLILTNLEYAQNHKANLLETRTFARNFQSSIVSKVEFINERKLSDEDVRDINVILKSRARKFIAAGKREWLYPEIENKKKWRELGNVLRPPENQLYRFGGEIIVKYDSGAVQYQDEFGRPDKPRPYLVKDVPVTKLGGKEPCGCGSGLSFKVCCEARPTNARPSWTEKSIRERNLMLFAAITKIFDLNDCKDWEQVRREITDEKIAEVYKLFASLWPLETDILDLLPKPDGRLRAVYTGLIHPKSIVEFALGGACILAR